MLCSVARGAPYAGRETMQGAVIYLTGEGVSGFKRRPVAMRRHLGIEGQGRTLVHDRERPGPR